MAAALASRRLILTASPSESMPGPRRTPVDLFPADPIGPLR